MAAFAGDCWGEFILGNFLFFGRGCEPDIDEATLYYQRAFDHGMYQSKIMLDKIKSIRMRESDD